MDDASAGSAMIRLLTPDDPQTETASEQYDAEVRRINRYRKITPALLASLGNTHLERALALAHLRGDSYGG